MPIFFHILNHNITPIFILIGLGFILSKKFTLDIPSLSKLLFYLLVPSFIFVNLYEAILRIAMLKIFFCGVLLLIANDILGRIVSQIRNYDVGMKNAFKNSIMFNNSGNIGLSLIILIFSSAPFVVEGETPYLDEAITTQLMILVLQNISSNTIGFFNAGRATMTVKDSLLRVFAMPSIYAIPIVFLLKHLEFDMTQTALWPALVYLKNGLVPISLLTLGAQLAKTTFDFKSVDVHLSVFTRLITGPILAGFFIFIMGFHGVVAQTILIAYSVPTAVNTALIAVECDSCQDFASQAVMVSTIFSAVTLTLAIYLARIIFPI